MNREVHLYHSDVCRFGYQFLRDDSGKFSYTETIHCKETGKLLEINTSYNRPESDYNHLRSVMTENMAFLGAVRLHDEGASMVGLPERPNVSYDPENPEYVIVEVGGRISIQIKQEQEGAVIDLYRYGDESEPTQTMCAYYSDYEGTTEDE